MENTIKPYYTYKDKRKCEHCGAPIADQAHKACKFCPRIVLPDNSVKSCKDDFHALQREEKNLPYKKIFKHHKLMHNNITNLFNAKGSTVTLEQMNQYGIILCRPAEFKVESDGIIYYFIEFAIKTISNDKFKITKHGRIL